MNPLPAPLSFIVLSAVAAGGATGSLLRYLLAQWLPRASGAFPVSTLAVNVVGSFLIGVFARMFAAADEHVLARAALMVGLCGGFTTFSAFSAEVVALAQEGRTGRAALYIAVSVVTGIAAVVAGFLVVNRWSTPRG